VTAPINLGVTQMCEHGLGSVSYNTWGGWSGSGYTGRVGLTGARPITIVNGKGALVVGFADFLCWTSIVGTAIQGSVVVDGGAQTVWSRLYFNKSGEYVQFSFGYYVGALAPGAHTIDFGVWIAAGSLNFDSACGGVFFGVEKA
jgi:hypothetical protein